MKICENSNDVKGYINVYLKAGTWACDYFTKEYMKKRSQYFEELRKLKAHNDDLCDATPANIPSAETYIDRTR